MASGKTAVGRRLAARLRLPFIDLDREIEKRAKKSVRVLFRDIGESGFRKLETALLKKTSLGGPRVIALGGGAILSSFNRSLLRRHGRVIYLSAPLSVLRRRGGKEKSRRPLWDASLAERFYQRLPLYRKTAHITVRASLGGPGDIARRIVTRLHETR